MAVSMKRRNEMYNKYDGRCYLCGCSIDINNFHVEHTKSKATGGRTNINNLNPACCICNLTKGALSIDEYREKLQNIHLTNTGAILLYKYQNVKIDEIVFYFELFSGGDGK